MCALKILSKSIDHLLLKQSIIVKYVSAVLTNDAANGASEFCKIRLNFHYDEGALSITCFSLLNETARHIQGP